MWVRPPNVQLVSRSNAAVQSFDLIQQPHNKNVLLAVEQTVVHAIEHTV